MPCSAEGPSQIDFLGLAFQFQRSQRQARCLSESFLLVCRGSGCLESLFISVAEGVSCTELFVAECHLIRVALFAGQVSTFFRK